MLAEGDPILLPDLNRLTWRDARAVDPDAVEGLEVFYPEIAALADEPAMMARYRRVIHHQIAVGGAAGDPGLRGNLWVG